MDQTNRIATKRALQELTRRVDLTSEAVLDEAIRPVGPPAAEPTRILLTGATGYLGASLLFELLKQTRAEVSCLVRAEDAATGRERIKATLESYGLWNPALAARIRPVVGDLAKPLLGLGEGAFHELAREIDAIYHGGALVNLLYPYAMIKSTNVGGLVELLRLASRGHGAAFHFISTAGIFVSPEAAGRRVMEDDELVAPPKGTPTGYMQSKWVADRILAIARKRGFPTTLYRPTFIGWRSATGVSNDKDFICGMLDGCLRAGVAPEMDMLIDCVSIDYVSEAVVHLSRQPASLGKVFHLCNPNRRQWNDVVDTCRALGCDVRRVHYPIWRRWLDDEGETAFCKRFSNLLPEAVPDSSDTLAECLKEGIFPSYDYRNAAEALAGTGITCAPLDAATLKPYVDRLKHARP